MGSTHRPTKIAVLGHVGLAGLRQDYVDPYFKELRQDSLSAMELELPSTLE